MQDRLMVVQYSKSHILGNIRSWYIFMEDEDKIEYVTPRYKSLLYQSKVQQAMNLFVGTPSDAHHNVTCEGCGKNIFLEHAKQHSGSHFCMSCYSKGKHKEHGMGFGPVRFSKGHGSYAGQY